MVVFVQKACFSFFSFFFWFWGFFSRVFFGVCFFLFVCSTTLPPPVNKICFGEETPAPRYKVVNITGDPFQDHILQ